MKFWALNIPGFARRIILSDEDRTTLLERFDLENLDGVRINRPCVCTKYYGCLDCPFREIGCGTAIKLVSKCDDLTVSSHFVYVWRPQDKQAVAAIHKFLLEAKEVE